MGEYCAAKEGFVAPGEIATKMTGSENVDPHELDRPGIPAGRPGQAAEIGESSRSSPPTARAT